ncbi:MAG TPA: response regulator, partial [Thermoanaerobaculia bacterium]|nr:response regulator [Thermoanaerobaculia bacterium]
RKGRRDAGTTPRAKGNAMRRRILVVDDDAAVRTMVRAVLERDGREAIALIAASDYDLVLLDVIMPNLDGVSVVHRLRQANSPVLAHTYLLSGTDPQQYGNLPVAGVIGKPFDIRALLAEAKGCIGH